MTKAKKIFYGTLMIVVLIIGGISWLLISEIGLTKEVIIEKARDELKRRNLPLEKMSAEADKENTAWREHVANNPLALEHETIKKMNLAEKDYWAVYFGPKVPRPGWDAWVFVDANKGEIIGVILGE